jgi:hypothetical protein
MRAGLALAAAAAAAITLASCASAPQPAAPRAEVPAQPVPAAEAAPLLENAVIAWTDEAQAAFTAEVPKMVQKIARTQMEKKARDRGISTIDMEFYIEMKKESGH